MSSIAVNIDALRNEARSCEKIAGNLQGYYASLKSILGNVRVNDYLKIRYESKLRSLMKEVDSQSNRIKKYGNALNCIASTYEKAEQKVRNIDFSIKVVGTISSVTGVAGRVGDVIDGFSPPGIKNESSGSSSGGNKINWFKWSDLWKGVAEFGIIGSVVAAGGNFFTEDDKAKATLNLFKDASKVVGKIAGAVPKSGTSFDWKTLIGFNTPTDVPKNFSEAWAKEWGKYNVGNASTTAGKIAAYAKWAGTIFTVATTAYDNFTDKKENNSLGRQIAETIGESTVKIVEGAALAAVFSTIGAPAVVAGGLAVVVAWGADRLCEAVTGKNLAEATSDFLLDAAEYVGEKITGAVKTAKDTVVNWGKKDQQ